MIVLALQMDASTFLLELDFYQHDRRAGIRPTIYLFCLDNGSGLMNKLGLSRADIDSLLVAALRPAMRSNSELAFIHSGVYAVLLPDSPRPMNQSFEQRFTMQVSKYGAENFGSTLFLSVSIGAAVQILGDSSRDWLWRAGRALNEAKKLGGNRQITNVNRKNSWLVANAMKFHPWMIPKFSFD